MRLAALIVFVAAFFAFAFLFLQMAVIWDSDSYYHLAVASHYVAHGVSTPVPWARFSLLADGADKELLFHIALMPFTLLVDPATGGRIALALFNAAIFTMIGWLCTKRLGGWGWAVPLMLWLAAPPFFARMVRLRPELFALLIILIAIPIAARRSWIALGVMAMLFAYSYTAFHVFVFICAVWIVLQRRLLPLAWVACGTLIGLFARPHAIANLHLWFVQNVTYFTTNVAGTGNEIQPPTIDVVLVSAGWLLFVALIAWRRPRFESDAIVAAVPAVVFTLLFLTMARMATYAFPLATIAIVYLLAERSRMAVAAIVAGMLIGIPITLANPLFRQVLRGGRVTEADWEQFGKSVPAGAKIAATWEAAEVYALYAPQGRYLNVLEPRFMSVPYPRQFAIQQALFDGALPDVATAVKRDLDSDYLAFDSTTASPRFVERVRHDPRLHVVYGGYNVLLRVAP